VVTRVDDAGEDVAEFRLVPDEPQQRVAAGAAFADAEQVFRRGIQRDDQQGAVQQGDAGCETVEDVTGVAVEEAAGAGAGAGAAARATGAGPA